MDLNDLFSKEQAIKAKYCGVDTVHYLRQPTSREDLEFRRKSANVKIRNREVQTSDAALQAPIELYDLICQRVVVENGAGPEEVPDFKARIPNDLKLAVIAAYQNRIEIETQAELGNSEPR
jgi:hypothetical protein